MKIKTLLASVAVAVALVAAFLVTTVTRDSESPPPETPADAITYGQAKDQLVEITGRIAPAGPMAGYDRDRLFPDWADLDRDGCDTRDEVLMRDAEEFTYFPRGDNCGVGTIRLIDPYGTGQIGNLGNIEIDHVVPLAVAWRSGGHAWTAQRWEIFANDETNLLAVDSHENQSKGDSTPDEWMPPPNFHCGYAKVYVNVVAHHRLTITQSTWDTLRDALESCPR